MATALNMEVIAEGVEDFLTRDRLYSGHCNALHFQGYFLSKLLTHQAANDLGQVRQKRNHNFSLNPVSV